jgi:hypothetical protein
MRITRSKVLGLSAAFVFGGSSSLLYVTADPPAPSPTSLVTGGVSRSVAPQPADRHVETLTVTILCEAPDGKPIAGAEVTCFEIDAWTRRERAKATHKTDATGTCRFDGVSVPLADVSRAVSGSADRLCTVAAKATGRASVVRTLTRRGLPAFQRIKGSTGSMKFVMEPAQSLHGRVTTSKGEPIEGVAVYTERQSMSRPFDGFCSAKTDKNGEYKITDLKGWARPKDAGSFAVDSRDGNAVVGHQVPDSFVVHVWHPDYGHKWASGHALPGELNVQLPETGLIMGRAVDVTTKRPLAGVLVYVESTRTPGGDFRLFHCSNWAITDQHGSYRLALRGGNDYQILSQFEGCLSQAVPEIRTLPANATVTADDLALVRAGVVRAHLINAESKQRIRFSSKPKRISVVLRSQPKGSKQDELFPAEFTEGSSFLMRAAIPGWTYSIAAESNDPTISPRPVATVFNVEPGETVEIDLPVDVRKPSSGL